ncbi:MAG: toll/interleukin-1 receptor domain-containing protein [Hyphomonadaceae bacterium]
MTIFLSHARADQNAAEVLETSLERRGHFVERDDGQAALRPVQASDVVILLVSKDFVFEPMRLRLEQRALDAWADGRLIIVKLDHGIAPVGLRDLPAIDASFEAQREFKWIEVANAVQEKLRAARMGRGAEAGAPPPARKQARRGGLWTWLLGVLVALPGLIAIAVIASIWLANRIGPEPGDLGDLRAGVEAFGRAYGAPAGVTEILFALAVLVMLGVFVAAVARLLNRGRPRRSVDAPAQAPSPESTEAADDNEAVFVSYARANQKSVLPVIEAAGRESGRRFWVDQADIATGDGWAGEIVRAIRGAPGVLVMCSKAAFESDHVKRELYLADRYRRRLVPVYVEDAAPPEDFEYFFAGVQVLRLYEKPEAERPGAVLAALGTPA